MGRYIKIKYIQYISAFIRFQTEICTNNLVSSTIPILSDKAFELDERREKFKIAASVCTVWLWALQRYQTTRCREIRAHSDRTHKMVDRKNVNVSDWLFLILNKSAKTLAFFYALIHGILCVVFHPNILPFCFTFTWYQTRRIYTKVHRYTSV